ncbi:hypothetical protein D9756_001109 [Leucocoprinus leucothites]|uniref:CFEM domain-containing protein n=1 Tax=Leucocoprinus leucothites TaxID=201217 RepID=A0A8H5GFB9_9AGAR|nr:hypothetical protein D9756_001109 [Leucoagaricus leucothites]
MLFNTKLVALILLTVGLVQAELTPCIQGCSQKAAQENGCGSFANRDCVCTNKKFQQQAHNCIADTRPGNAFGCKSDDMAKAKQLEAQNCGH